MEFVAAWPEPDGSLGIEFMDHSGQVVILLAMDAEELAMVAGAVETLRTPISPRVVRAVDQAEALRKPVKPKKSK